MMQQLSNRLQAIADLVTPGVTVCDVGTDHGFVPIALVQQNRAVSCIAMDVRKGPLSSADAHIRQAGLSGKITTRLSDGLVQLQPGEAYTVIIAGMGGRLMQRILEDGNPAEKQVQELILQPQSEIPQFRQFLREKDYEILEENMIREDGKIYPMMKCCVGCSLVEESPMESDLSSKKPKTAEMVAEMLSKHLQISKEKALQLTDAYGPILLRDKNDVLKEFLLHGKTMTQQLLHTLSRDSHPERVAELEEERERIFLALSWFEQDTE